jgi:hypothetical protein
LLREPLNRYNPQSFTEHQIGDSGTTVRPLNSESGKNRSAVMEYCNLGKNEAQKEEKSGPDKWANFFQWPFT